MNGLACNAWRDPWYVRALRSMRRHPWPVVQQVGAWAVRVWIVVGWIVVIPLAIYLQGSK